MPRYENKEQDLLSKQTLKILKDQAENVMIVDLLRNDLSIYANIGSVKTTKLFEIESFNQVHHMVSEITATLKMILILCRCYSLLYQEDQLQELLKFGQCKLLKS